MDSTQRERFGVRWAARPDWGMPAGPPAPPESGGARSSLQPRGAHTAWGCAAAGPAQGARVRSMALQTCFRPPRSTSIPGPTVMAPIAWKRVLPCSQEWWPLSWSGDSDSSGTATWTCCHLATASSAHRGRGGSAPPRASQRPAAPTEEPAPCRVFGLTLLQPAIRGHL